MIRYRATVIFITLSLFTAAAANAVTPLSFESLTITDTTGTAITQCQPSQEIRVEAAYSLNRPSLILLNGAVTGSNWTVKLPYRVRLRLGGLYSVVWRLSIPFTASGEAKVDVVEYIPLVRERILKTAYITVVPFDADYVGSDACSGCHAPLYTAWQETEHYPYTGCESCHGPGGDHIASPSADTIIVDTSASVCKPCHSRNDGTVIEAEDGFIKSQQQYNEWVDTRHGRFLQCAGCHDPHYSLERSPLQAIKISCRLCHLLKSQSLGMQFVKCASCHMAPAVKAVDSTWIGPYRKGDTSSHIWRINTVAEPYQMFVLDGTAAVKDFRGPFLTLNFACLSCHNGNDSRIYNFDAVQQTSTLVH